MFAFEEWANNLFNLERLIAADILAIQAFDDVKQDFVQSSDDLRYANSGMLKGTHMVAAKNEMLLELLPSTDGGDNGSTSISTGISSFT